MNLNLNFLVLVLIFCFLPNVSSNFTILQNLLRNMFKSSNSTNHVSSNLMPSTVSKSQRSTLISEDDHKLKTGNDLSKSNVLQDNFIAHLKDMLTKKSVETDHQDSIVNIDDEGPNEDDFMKNDNEIDLDSVNKLNNNEAHFMATGTDDETVISKNEDDDDESNGSSNDGFSMTNNQQEDNDDEDEDEDEGFFARFFFRKSVNHKKSNSFEDNLNQTIKIQNSTVNLIHSNQKSDNSSATNSTTFKSNLTSYVYLVGKNSSLFGTSVNYKLIGNTLESFEKILDKYTFINLYSAPTINDTHNDRDLHQKEDDKVVLKANFADYPAYQNTDRSPVIGLEPPVQNLTDIRFGNFQLKNHSEITEN